jgi:glucose-6-phosphate isomerase
MDRRTRRRDLLKNPAYMWALVNYLAYERGRRIAVMMPYSQALRDVADWFRQLWAESLGKRVDLDGRVVNVGPTPVKALGATDQHSQVQLYKEGPLDKIITFLAVAEHPKRPRMPKAPRGLESAHYLGGRSLANLFEAERLATAHALAAAGRPNVTAKIGRVDEEHLGALFYLFETATAMAGKLFGVNAFDQPGVAAGKAATFALMGREGYEKEAAEIREAAKAGARRRFVIR